MHSRRLGISDLLCNDSTDDPPQHPSRSIDSLIHPVNAYRPQPSSLPYVGLEALVHAATEEHRRINSHDNLLHPHDGYHHHHPYPPRYHHQQEPLIDVPHLLAPRKSDPTHLPDILYPPKKRRFSDSSSDDKERITRERERMLVGELGYGRSDIIAAATTRPSSGHGRKVLAVADLVSQDSHRVLTPLGRRSPPGSQIGRAKAARKVDDSLSHIVLPDRTTQPLQPLPELWKKEKVKEEPKPLSFRDSPVDVTHHRQQQDDPHEWFLEHYAEYTSRQEPPRSPSPSISPTTSTLPKPLPPSLRPPPTTSPKHSISSIHTPATMPEAAVALEHELEAPTSQEEPDLEIDVDQAVTDLVKETLEGEDMDVDVEDELLSLVDDRTPPHPHSRRPIILPAPKPQLPPPRPVTGDTDKLSPPSLSVPSPSHSAMRLSPALPPSSAAKPVSVRESMPPPPSTTLDGVARKGDRAGSASAPAGKKKAAPKSKTLGASASAASAKPRAKPAPKNKKTAAATASGDSITPPLLSKPPKASGPPGKKNNSSTSRSRSTSVMPGGSVGPEPSAENKAEKQEEEEDSDAANEDDKLYCVCKTRYDEDRFMIACDRCDEWYHTQCVDMPDLEVDLVDQFICPPCIEKNPQLSLSTTYKQRCLYGLKHPEPHSPKACHKPARGAFSKYCSDECGVKYMQSRIDSWAKKGGKKEKLWESVKNAEKREGVVTCVDRPEPSANDHLKKSDRECDVKPNNLNGNTKKSKVEREAERLKGLLEHIVKLREEIKNGMEVLVWRERLIQLASDRAESVGQCGWDQRLCFGDEEWADFGAGVLESYEEGGKGEGDDMQVDGAVGEGEGEWWCPGKKVCDRHAGWQTVRFKDVCKEKEKKEEALLKLTTREREIRKRIEDISDPQRRATTVKDASSQMPLKSSNSKANGQAAKGKTTGDSMKKGKKRKMPPS